MQQLQKYKTTKFEEIPQSWKYYTLTELASSDKNSIRRGPWGGSIKKNMFVPKGFKVYEQKNVIYENFRSGNYYIDDEKFSELGDFQVLPNDILISCSGTFGKIAIVPNNAERGIINQALLKITLNRNIISIIFFKYFFQSEDIQKKFFGMTHGSAIKNMISISDMKKMQFLIPPLKEQQKIASILSNVDRLIQKTDQIIEQTQRLKKGLMQRLLTEGMGHTKFKKASIAIGFRSELIPVDWATKKLKNLCNVVRGGSPRPAGDPKYFGGNIPWITVGELTKDDSIYLNSVENSLTEAGKEKSRFLGHNTVLLANSGATLGIPKILGISGCINDGIAAFLNLDKKLSSLFLYFMLYSWVDIFRGINQGMGQPNLNTEIIGNINFPLPSLEEQNKIIVHILKITEKIENINNYKSHLQNVKKGLMQQLLTGKLRVKV